MKWDETEDTILRVLCNLDGTNQDAAKAGFEIGSKADGFPVGIEFRIQIRLRTRGLLWGDFRLSKNLMRIALSSSIRTRNENFVEFHVCGIFNDVFAFDVGSTSLSILKIIQDCVILLILDLT